MLRDTNDQKDQKEKPFFSFSLSSVFLVDLLPLRCVQKGQLTKLVSLPSPFFPRYSGLPPSFTPLPTFFLWHEAGISPIMNLTVLPQSFPAHYCTVYLRFNSIWNIPWRIPELLAPLPPMLAFARWQVNTADTEGGGGEELSLVRSAAQTTEEYK